MDVYFKATFENELPNKIRKKINKICNSGFIYEPKLSGNTVEFNIKNFESRCDLDANLAPIQEATKFINELAKLFNNQVIDWDYGIKTDNKKPYDKNNDFYKNLLSFLDKAVEVAQINGQALYNYLSKKYPDINKEELSKDCEKFYNLGKLSDDICKKYCKKYNISENVFNNFIEYHEESKKICKKLMEIINESN